MTKELEKSIIEQATEFIRKAHGARMVFSHIHQWEGEDQITVYAKSTPIFYDTTDYHPCLHMKLPKDEI